MAEPLPEKCKIIANRNWFQFNTETSRNRESAGHLGLPFFQKVAEEQENGKEQTKKGPLSRSDFQVKKGHCKKAYPNIYMYQAVAAVGAAMASTLCAFLRNKTNP